MNSKQKGYILLETLIGVGILAIVIVSVLGAVSQNILSVEEIKKQSIAITLAQKKMEEMGTLDRFKAADAGDFGATFPGYKWEIAGFIVQQTNAYSLVNIKLSVAYEVRGAPRGEKLETMFVIPRVW